MKEIILLGVNKENKKGFTLVELIVVLVILAILAAILVPALLGWIDKAKEKQILLDARNAYIAAQEVISEDYAKATPLIDDDMTDLNGLAPGMAEALIAEIEELSDIGENAGVGNLVLDNHKVIGITYIDEDAEVGAILQDGEWKIYKISGS